MASRNQRKKKRANKRGSGSPAAGSHSRTESSDGVEVGTRSRGSSETKPSYKTTELIAYAATVLAVLLTALALDDDGQGGADPFGAEPAIRYVVYLTIGYLVARGLAKSGSWATRSGRDHDQDDTPAVAEVEHRDVDVRDHDTESDTDHGHSDHHHANHDHADHADEDHADHDKVLTGARDSVERDRFGAPTTGNRTDGS